MKVTFWGTRGSIPTPLAPHEVGEKICQAILQMPAIDTHNIEVVRSYVASLPPLLRGTAGGNSPCVQIESGQDIFIMDAGSGIRELGIKLMQGPCGQGKGNIHLFISHLHWDHIQGFMMFAPAFVEGNHISIYGRHETLQKTFEEQQNPRNWPVSISYMKAEKDFIILDPTTPLQIDNITIRTIKNSHPGDSYSYRFEDLHSVFVYASDAEYKDLNDSSVLPYIAFFKNADALVFDTQYTLRQAWQRVDWGHSSAMIGLDLARAANVKQFILFHHDPTCSDEDLKAILQTAEEYQAQDTTHPACDIIAAYEGLALDLTPPGTVDMEITDIGDAAILIPTKIFDGSVVDQVIRRLSASSEEAALNSIIDLSKVETLTTASLKALVTSREGNSSSPIVLAAPSQSVQRVTNLAGYRDSFAIYPSVKAALAAMRAIEAAHLPGQILLGRYQIEAQVGKSQLGTVLKALDTQTDRAVALKILSPAFSQETLEHFMHQAQQTISLDHPNIIKVFAWAVDKGRTFKVEEFMTGPTLEAILQKRKAPLPADQAMDIALDIAYALEYAHRRGVIHGDLKPSNIFLTATGARVNGFGLGRLTEGHNLLDMPLVFLDASYIAPEQILGQPLDARTDLYSLGVILYQLFTGELPFKGSEEQILQSHLRKSVLPPREINPHLSLSLEHLIRKLLAKNPNDRYASVQQARRISSSLLIHKEDMPHQRHTLMVGRGPQIKTLRKSWKRASAGYGQLAIISGELGIGKTTLAQQVAMQSQPTVLLKAQCKQRTGTPAYALFSEILHLYFATVPPEFNNHQVQQFIRNFMYLLPQAKKMLANLTPVPPLEPEQEQLRLMSSLTHFIKCATNERPWLLILDDLQWADPKSLELLRYIGRHIPSMALMIIGIYREDDMPLKPALKETLRDLSEYPGYVHIHLERLEEPEVKTMLSYLLQQSVPSAFSVKIYEHTAGNPFYVEEIIHSLIDEGQIRMQGGRWYYPTLTDVHFPPSVREAVWHRIGQLSPDTQALLRQAAILGHTFKFADLREMSGLSEWQLLEHLDLAMSRQLVQEIPGDTLLCFRNTEIQQVLYADLGTLRRRMLHRQAGLALEKRMHPHQKYIAEELAHHFSQAKEIKKALHYSIKAGQQAQSAYSNNAALLWYKQALTLLDQLNRPPQPILQSQYIAIYQAMGDVQFLTGGYKEAVNYYHKALTLLPKKNITPLMAQTFAHLCHQLAQVFEKRSKHKKAISWLEKGLRQLETQHPTLEMAHLYVALGLIHIFLGNGEIAKKELGEARAIARAAQNQIKTHSESSIIPLRKVEADSLNALGNIAKYYVNLTEAYAYYEQALHIFQEIGDKQGEGLIFKALGNVALNLGENSKAKKYYKKALHNSQDIGDRQGESSTLNNLGIITRREGNYVKAREYYERSLRISREIGNEQEESYTLGNLGFTLLHLGDYVSARTCYEKSLKITRALSNKRGESWTLHNLANLSQNLGQYDAAESYAQQALATATEIEDLRAKEHALISLAHVQIGKKEFAEAQQTYQEALDLQKTMSKVHSPLEPLAGMACVQMAQGYPQKALARVEEIFTYLKENPPGNLEDPLWVYMTCYAVLCANHDPRADKLITNAHQRLQSPGEKINNQFLAHTFSENMPRVHTDNHFTTGKPELTIKINQNSSRNAPVKKSADEKA